MKEGRKEGLRPGALGRPWGCGYPCTTWTEDGAGVPFPQPGAVMRRNGLGLSRAPPSADIICEAGRPWKLLGVGASLPGECCSSKHEYEKKKKKTRIREAIQRERELSRREIPSKKAAPLGSLFPADHVADLRAGGGLLPWLTPLNLAQRSRTSVSLFLGHLPN